MFDPPLIDDFIWLLALMYIHFCYNSKFYLDRTHTYILIVIKKGGHIISTEVDCTTEAESRRHPKWNVSVFFVKMLQPLYVYNFMLYPRLEASSKVNLHIQMPNSWFPLDIVQSRG